MTLDDIRIYVHEQPFKPFRVHLSDGRNVLVSHPDFIALPPPDNRATMITVYEDRFARHIYIRNITSIDVERPVEQTPQQPNDGGGEASGNGHPNA